MAASEHEPTGHREPGGGARARAIVLALGALLLLSDALILFLPPVVGVADNGDFVRVMGPAGIRHTAPIDSFRARFVRVEFESVAADFADHPSSSSVVAWAAKGLSARGPFARGALDLRQVGVVHVLLLVAFASVLARAEPWVLGAGALLFWVSSDPGYLLFFNTFFADAALFLAVFGITVGLLVHDGGAPPRVRASFAVAVLVGTWLGAFSKQAYSPLGLVLVLALLLAHRRMPLPLDRRALGAFAALSVLALLAPAYFLWGGGLRYPSNNRYDSVFRGIALVSADPAATLAQLDVDPEARRLVGTSYFDAGLSQADLARADHVSLFRVAGLYLQHPATIVEAGRRVGAVLAKPYSVSLGQYTESESRGKKRYFRPLMFHFSRVRPFVLGRPWAVWTWAALSSSWAASSLVRRRRDLFATATVFLVILFASQVVIVVIGEGFFALARHLLAARFALDGAVVLSLLGVVREVFPGWSRRSARRVKRWNAGSEGRARAIYRHLFIASRSGDAPS